MKQGSSLHAIWTKALELQPSNTVLLNNRAMAYLKQAREIHVECGWHLMCDCVYFYSTAQGYRRTGWRRSNCPLGHRSWLNLHSGDASRSLGRCQSQPLFGSVQGEHQGNWKFEWSSAVLTFQCDPNWATSKCSDQGKQAETDLTVIHSEQC